MKITCPYCGKLFESSNAQCPHCLAPNEHQDVAPIDSAEPTTIDALKRWYIDKKLPPFEITRFFIGENVKEPRAFGIYRDGNKVIVYKNKDNGQRAIRYQGSDEGYAVSEFLNKLKDEILHQQTIGFDSGSALQDVQPESIEQSQQSVQSPVQPQRRQTSLLKKLLIFFAILLLVSMLMRSCSSTPTADLSPGYYNYDGGTYYHTQQDDSWYSYDNGSWSPIQNIPGVIIQSGSDYFSGSGYHYSSSYGVPYYSDFAESEYYDDYADSWEPSSSSSSSSWSSNDDDDDWDWSSSDSWDSGYSDWDSDW